MAQIHLLMKTNLTKMNFLMRKLKIFLDQIHNADNEFYRDLDDFFEEDDGNVTDDTFYYNTDYNAQQQQQVNRLTEDIKNLSTSQQ